MKSFAEKVFSVVSEIPRGKVLSYKEVAIRAGSKRAFRAVGNILNRNPHPVVVPCHRVICSDGSLGGYRFGLKRKTSLLKREGVLIRNNKVIS